MMTRYATHVPNHGERVVLPAVDTWLAWWRTGVRTGDHTIVPPPLGDTVLLVEGLFAIHL